MKITRQIAADKLADYLHGKLSQSDLVNWAEHAMMDAEFDDADTEVLADLIGRLGLADVAEFGLRGQDCEEFLRRLGYRATAAMSLTEILAEIPKLSFSERQELVRRAIAIEEEELTPEENAILDQRLEDFQRDPASGIPAEDLKGSVLKHIKNQ